LPTGDSASLLGAGTGALRLMAIVSAERSRVGVQGNVSMMWGGVSDGFATSGGASVAITQRVTAAGELLLRRMADLHTIVPEISPHPIIAGVDTLRLVPGTDTPLLSSAVTGVKWNVQGRFVLSGQVQWRLSNAGLTARWVPTISADYLF
jgi:hypothetical protein